MKARWFGTALLLGFTLGVNAQVTNDSLTAIADGEAVPVTIENFPRAESDHMIRQNMRAFGAMGVPVIDADLLARELVKPGQAALDEIVAPTMDEMAKRGMPFEGVLALKSITRS